MSYERVTPTNLADVLLLEPKVLIRQKRQVTVFLKKCLLQSLENVLNLTRENWNRILRIRGKNSSLKKMQTPKNFSALPARSKKLETREKQKINSKINDKSFQKCRHFRSETPTPAHPER